MAPVKVKKELSVKQEPIHLKKEYGNNTEKYARNTTPSHISKIENKSQTNQWTIGGVISSQMNKSKHHVESTINLLDEGSTIPFIARYRQSSTGQMTADELRTLSAMNNNLRSIQEKASKMISVLDKNGKLDAEKSSNLLNVHVKSELDHLCKLYNPNTNKGTKAHRARQLPGISEASITLLNGGIVRAQALVNSKIPGLDISEDVELAIQHVIADTIYTDSTIIDFIRRQCDASIVSLKSDKVQTKTKEEKNTHDVHQFKQYYEFRSTLSHISPHQVLAIFRGETQKKIKLTINLDARLQQKLENCANSKWPKVHSSSRPLFLKSIDDSYARLIKPMLKSKIRSEMFDRAEASSLKIFQDNLRQLLLTPPMKGKVVLGVDPGFSNGCKLAVTNQNLNILATAVSYIHNSSSYNQQNALNTIKSLIITHKCTNIAIGNGTACRETEQFFSEHFKLNTFSPMHPSYCIVNETGASTYSASKVGQEELPDMNIMLRSAVSIARRVQNPLAEYVKIEPKHLGVGMYQHDIAECKLKSSLAGIVEECVSFVGVDVNSASEILLMHVAGIGKGKAKKILKYRDEKGIIVSRAEISTIPGIGPKTFEQIAGFIRILQPTNDSKIQEMGKRVAMSMKSADSAINEPEAKKKSTKQSKSTRSKKSNTEFTYNKLDMTTIHPESYCFAERILKRGNFTTEDIGSDKLLNYAKSLDADRELKFTEGCKLDVVQGIISSLQTPLQADLRDEYSGPIFRQEILSSENLKIGSRVSGKVMNVCTFGAFIDIGVEKNALVHKSVMKNRDLKLGDIIEVKINGMTNGKISASL